MRAVPRAASVWLSEADSAASLHERPDRAFCGPCIVISRLVRSADFERVLRTRTRVNSAHFAVHHLPTWPSVPAKPVTKVKNTELSTGDPEIDHRPVDTLPSAVPAAAEAVGVIDAPSRVWLGAVVPKRHARRSVTRTLLKRQIRAIVTGHVADLPGGLWVVRLRAPFDRAHFVSASSDALKRAAHAELDLLMSSAAQRVAAGR
jgi:ribonuclease P protein component